MFLDAVFRVVAQTKIKKLNDAAAMQSSAIKT